MLNRENEDRKEFLDTKARLVLLVCLEKEVYQGRLDIKEGEEIQEDQDHKGHLVSKANEGCKGLEDLLDLQASLEIRVTLDLLALQENLVLRE